MDEDDSLFVLIWDQPRNDATDAMLCEYCGAVRYSSTQNIRAAAEAKMHAACVTCTIRMLREHQGVMGGWVRDGAVVEARKQN